MNSYEKNGSIRVRQAENLSCTKPFSADDAVNRHAAIATTV